MPRDIHRVKICQRSTITVRLSGGLGNQMFQYAFGRAVSIKTGAMLGLDDARGFIGDRYARKMTLDCFPIAAQCRQMNQEGFAFLVSSHPRILKLVSGFQQMVNWGKPRIYHERSLFAFDESHFHTAPSAYFVGYWQNPMYFAEIASVLRQELTFPGPKREDYVGMLVRQMNGSNSVAIHVRRYDLADLRRFGKIRSDQLTLDQSYYEQALDTLARKERDVRFFIFSDGANTELPFLLQKQIVRVDSTLIGDDAAEQWLMSKCKHQIIANSTYSWWAAWLNANPAKTIIAPRKWFRGSLSNNGIFPADWIVLGR